MNVNVQKVNTENNEFVLRLEQYFASRFGSKSSQFTPCRQQRIPLTQLVLRVQELPQSMRIIPIPNMPMDTITITMLESRRGSRRKRRIRVKLQNWSPPRSRNLSWMPQERRIKRQRLVGYTYSRFPLRQSNIVLEIWSSICCLSVWCRGEGGVSAPPRSALPSVALRPV